MARVDHMEQTERSEQGGRRASEGGPWPGLIAALVDAAPDAILVVDGAGRIVLANATAEQLFGYTPQELTGLPVDTLLPNRDRDMHERHRAEYAAAPRMRPMGVG